MSNFTLTIRGRDGDMPRLYVYEVSWPIGADLGAGPLTEPLSWLYRTYEEAKQSLEGDCENGVQGTLTEREVY